MSEIVDYRRADTIQEACTLLEQPSTRVLAGGTDILLRLNRSTDPVTLVDITAIQEMTGIRQEQDGIRIGAMTRLADMARAAIFQQPVYRALFQGTIQIGSPQIRNLASIGGNLCNAAPSADTAAPLLALDAQAEITSRKCIRYIPLAEFFLGPGKTALTQGEMLTSILIPTPAAGSRSVYLKHSTRRAMDLAFVGVAVVLQNTAERQTAIALSAVAPTPIRVSAAEQVINQAKDVTEAILMKAARLSAETARPISDIRSTAAYRGEMINVLTLRALRQIFEC
ncbi:MAG: FAD binding domain-containing protein [Anaerolineaceae bacterium]|nr:FAD binding domain-containing protein [Anaerolineaceae bacterium]